MHLFIKRFKSISHIPDFSTFLSQQSSHLEPNLSNLPTPLASPLFGLKYHIQTYGCQMNENDSEIVSGILATAGLQLSASIESV